MNAVNIAEKFSQFQDRWSPKIIGEINDSYVKAVKLRGESSGTITTMKTKCSSW